MREIGLGQAIRAGGVRKLKFSRKSGRLGRRNFERWEALPFATP